MGYRLAFAPLWALALLVAGVPIARAQSECPYLTRPLVEVENGITRINQWAHGTLLCYRGRMYRCEVGNWFDYGDCPASLDWQARDATLRELAAQPEGAVTPAPALPAGTELPSPPTLSQPLAVEVPERPIPSVKPLPAPTEASAVAPVESPAPEPATIEPDTAAAPPPDKAAAPAEPPPPPPPPQPAGAPPTANAAPAIDCSDMQRMSYERVFGKSIAEAQRCQAGCGSDDCKSECQRQHETVRKPQILERFHADVCAAAWYP
jgi:hypothetical protein